MSAVKLGINYKPTTFFSLKAGNLFICKQGREHKLALKLTDEHPDEERAFLWIDEGFEVYDGFSARDKEVFLLDHEYRIRPINPLPYTPDKEQGLTWGDLILAKSGTALYCQNKKNDFQSGEAFRVHLGTLNYVEPGLETLKFSKWELQYFSYDDQEWITLF